LHYYIIKRKADGATDAFSRKQMTPHACRYQEEAAQRKLRLFKRGESGFSKTVKYHGIRNTAVSETYPNTTKFLILWYFIKTIVFLENYKNTLYPNRTLVF
jgi:hypothetical protein